MGGNFVCNEKVEVDIRANAVRPYGQWSTAKGGMYGILCRGELCSPDMALWGILT